jgi:hypothetical protein
VNRTRQLDPSSGPGPPAPPPPAVMELRGEVHPSRAGFSWWHYRRPAAPPAATAAGDSGAGSLTPPHVEHHADGASEPAKPASIIGDQAGSSAQGPAAIGGLLLLSAVVAGRLESNLLASVLIVVAALLLATAAGRVATGRRPAEPWIGRMLLLGVVAKVAASLMRYRTLVTDYDGVGDATMYDEYGQEFANAWLTGGTAPDLPHLTSTNFVRWFTGVVYYVFGIDMITGFIVFGLLALIGSYLWYRATADALPFLDKRLYLALVMFVPSIVFWPSSIGKEALMQLGIGVMALGTSLLLRSQLLRGLAVTAAGGWLVWVVRPHLLALVGFAGGIAYIFGQVRRRRGGATSLLSRPVGIVAIGLLLVFAISEGAAFLGIEELSLSSIQEELDEQTERSAQGGSQFDHGGNSLNPIHLPMGAITVLIRPFPWEIQNSMQLLAALEGTLLALALVWRLSSVRAALRRARTHAYLLYCWVLTALYAATFSSFANFGLLVRQRSLVLPAVFVLLAIDARKARQVQAGDEPDDVPSPGPVSGESGGRGAPIGTAHGR